MYCINPIKWNENPNAHEPKETVDLNPTLDVDDYLEGGKVKLIGVKSEFTQLNFKVPT